jgi:hypothetical protein
MTFPEPTPSGQAPPRRGPSRGPLVAAGGGLAALIVGIVLAVVGQTSASSASSDLGAAQRHLRQQQSATAHAEGCASDLRASLGPDVAAAQALLTTAGQIAGADQQITTAAHDKLNAGSRNDIGSFNDAVTRGNNAAGAANGLLDTINRQLGDLQVAATHLPASCS